MQRVFDFIQITGGCLGHNGRALDLEAMARRGSGHDAAVQRVAPGGPVHDDLDSMAHPAG